jgi:hypothetical protein
MRARREPGIEESCLFLARFLFRGPISLQFGRQLRFRCRTHCFLLCLRSGSDWRRWIRATKVRPSCFLSRRNLLFRSSAHSFFPWRSSSTSRRTENPAQLFVQTLDLFFNCRSSFELVNCKVEGIHRLLDTIQNRRISSDSHMLRPLAPHFHPNRFFASKTRCKQRRGPAFRGFPKAQISVF